MSVKSYASSRMSGASNLSKKSLKAGEARPGLQAAGAQAALEVSDTESQLSHVHTQYSNLNEEDEWTAIQNFNTILHYLAGFSFHASRLNQVVHAPSGLVIELPQML